MERCRKDEACRFCCFEAGREWRQAEPRSAPVDERCNLEDQRMAAGCLLNRAGESKMEIHAWIFRIVDF
jgi:hypothetical protein